MIDIAVRPKKTVAGEEKFINDSPKE